MRKQYHYINRSYALLPSFSFTRKPLPVYHIFSSQYVGQLSECSILSGIQGRKDSFLGRGPQSSRHFEPCSPWNSHLSSTSYSFSLSFSMSERGKGKEEMDRQIDREKGMGREQLLNYELLAFQFLQSARLEGREHAQVCSRKALLGKRQIKGITLLPDLSLFGQPILPVRKCVPYVQDVQDVHWLVNGALSKVSNQCRFNKDIDIGYLKPGVTHR